MASPGTIIGGSGLFGIFAVALGAATAAVLVSDAVGRREGGRLGSYVVLALPTMLALRLGGVAGALVFVFVAQLPILAAIRLWQWGARHIGARREPPAG
jgi:hypothetical protein